MRKIQTVLPLPGNWLQREPRGLPSRVLTKEQTIDSKVYMRREPKSYAQEHVTGTGTDSKAHAKAVSRVQRFERLQNFIAAIHDVRSHSGVGAFDILRAELLRQNRVMVGRQPLALSRRIVEPVEDQDLIPFNGHAQGGISAAFRNPHVKPEMRLGDRFRDKVSGTGYVISKLLSTTAATSCR